MLTILLFEKSLLCMLFILAWSFHFDTLGVLDRVVRIFTNGLWNEAL